MGLGDTARRLKLLAEKAEKLYEQIIALRNQVLEVRQTLDETNDRVTAVEGRLERQEAILAAVAEKHEIDVEELVAELGDTTDGDDATGEDEAAGEADEAATADAETAADGSGSSDSSE